MSDALTDIVGVSYSPGMVSKRTECCFQWDYGLKLRIYDMSTSATVEAHFAYEGQRMPAKVVQMDLVDDAYEANIPDELLVQVSPIRCYVQAWNETEGRTLFEIIIPVLPRPMPDESE